MVGLFILLAFTVIAFPLLFSSGDNDKAFRGQTDYYIGLQKADGSCMTAEVYATDLQQAKQVVRDKYCDNCTLRNLTPDYLSVRDGNTFLALGEQCPLI
jgi:hypothetical protein